MQFIHKLTASDTPETAKITKKVIGLLLGDVGNITFLMIFAVLYLDLSLAVNLKPRPILALLAYYCSTSNSYFSFFINSRRCCNSGLVGTYFWPWPDLCP